KEKKRIDGERAQEKRHRQTCGIAAEQPDAVAGGGRQREDRAEDRPDARDPRDGEGDPDERRAEIAGRFVLQIDLEIAIEGGDFNEAQQIDADENHRDAAGDADEAAMAGEYAVKRAGGG